jgi:hypothetical protein
MSKKRMIDSSREEIVKQINLECDVCEDRIDESIRLFCKELEKLDEKESESWSLFGQRVYEICKKFRDKKEEKK